ncbi:putative xylanase/chitin deacetylase [Thiovulum sp. ES]|nr:putative xylanase/chitin deacetylase [Thiovulum sp. ES]
MRNIFITLDYELFFGSNSGTVEKSILYPTNKLLEVLDKYNVKASFFVDSGYLLKSGDKEVISQIEKLSKEGHDIQLHIHPHWEDSYFQDSWKMDTTRYRLHQFENIDEIVGKYKKALTDIVENQVFVFRAGGWCIQPFDKIKDALKKENIWLDSTLFYGGRNKSETHFFDFRNSPKMDFWQFEEDPLIEKDGFFTEIPISSYKLSPLFFWKLAFFKKFGGQKYKSFGDGSAIGGSKWDKIRMLTSFSWSPVSIDGYKSSFLQKAFEEFSEKNFVIIGHPKALSKYSLKKLEEFIKKNISENFTTYSKEFLK